MWSGWRSQETKKGSAPIASKPPSLKEQALEALNSFEGFTGSLEEVDIIRRALESIYERTTDETENEAQKLLDGSYWQKSDCRFS